MRMVSGVALEASTCRDALERLGCVVAGSGETLDVTPPSARTDVTREVDVIEEVLRDRRLRAGARRAAGAAPAAAAAPRRSGRRRAARARRGRALRGDHVRASSPPSAAAPLGLAATDRRAQPIAIHNPMSADQALMRTSLLPNLIAAVTRNQSHGRPDVALFEVGSVFLRRGEGAGERPIHELADEPLWAAGVLAGRRPGHIGPGTPWDVFDAKALRAGRDPCDRGRGRRDQGTRHGDRAVPPPRDRR